MAVAEFLHSTDSLMPGLVMMTSGLFCTAAVCQILAFAVGVPGASAAARKWAREHRRRGYRLQRSAPAKWPGRGSSCRTWP